MSAATHDGRTLGAMESVEEFLAHALTLENEAAAGYQEIGDSLAVHNNPEVADLFFRMAKYGRMHAAEVRALAEGLTLPHIAPWDFAWADGESPEAPAADAVHYLMKPAQALSLAMNAERQAHAFYSKVAAASPVSRVRELAAQFAEEEAEHVRLLSEWIDRYPATHSTPDDDPDPPSMPE